MQQHFDKRALEEEKEVSEQETNSEKRREDHFASTYSLKPNENYDANHYSYETDRYGRITRCEGTLRLEEGKRNTAHQIRAGGKERLESDDGGHLIARRFGGSEKIDNLVPMDSHVNRSEYKELEEDWAKEIENGNTVDVQIRCKYEGDSQRPSSFIVKYKVTEPNGMTYQTHRILKNGKEGG